MRFAVCAPVPSALALGGGVPLTLDPCPDVGAGVVVAGGSVDIPDTVAPLRHCLTNHSAVQTSKTAVWHPRASPPSQVTYGLGVGATTIVGAGEAGATELAEGHPGQRVPGAKGTQGLLQVMRLQNEEARRSALSLS